MKHPETVTGPARGRWGLVRAASPSLGGWERSDPSVGLVPHKITPGCDTVTPRPIGVSSRKGGRGILAPKPHSSLRDPAGAAIPAHSPSDPKEPPHLCPWL